MEYICCLDIYDTSRPIVVAHLANLVRGKIYVKWDIFGGGHFLGGHFLGGHFSAGLRLRYERGRPGSAKVSSKQLERKIYHLAPDTLSLPFTKALLVTFSTILVRLKDIGFFGYGPYLRPGDRPETKLTPSLRY